MAEDWLGTPDDRRAVLEQITRLGRPRFDTTALHREVLHPVARQAGVTPPRERRWYRRDRAADDAWCERLSDLVVAFAGLMECGAVVPVGRTPDDDANVYELATGKGDNE